MTFDGPLVLFKGKTLDDLKNSLKVYINNTLTDAVDSVSIIDNVLTVQLKQAIKGNNTVVIDYNFYHIFMKAYNGCYAFIQKRYTWLLPLPTAMLPTHESVNATVNTELNALVKPIITNTFNSIEIVPVDVTPTLNATVQALIVNEVGYTEQPVISITSTLTLTVIKVGVTPV